MALSKRFGKREAGLASLIGVMLAIAFGILSDSSSGLSAALAFFLALGVPVGFFLLSLFRREWVNAGVAVAYGLVAYLVFIVYLVTQVSGPPD